MSYRLRTGWPIAYTDVFGRYIYLPAGDYEAEERYGLHYVWTEVDGAPAQVHMPDSPIIPIPPLELLALEAE